MPRKKRPLERDDTVVRDANLIVIATEDQYAPKVYFDRFKLSRVKCKILPAEEGRSSPQGIVDRLHAFRNEFDIGENDQLWYCGDLDHWAEPNHIQGLMGALRECRQSGYGVAISNPCFEIWLLFHFRHLSAEIGCSAEHVEAELRRHAKGYSKRSGCVTHITTEMVDRAIERARTMDTSPDDLIPPTATSRVYLIVDELKCRQTLELKNPLPRR